MPINRLLIKVSQQLQCRTTIELRETDADGSVQRVPGRVNEKTLRALFSRNGRDVVNPGPD